MLLVLAGLAAGVVLFIVGLVVATGVTVEEEEATDPGDRYCSAEKEDQLAALETGSGETVNSPRLLRRATRRFIRATRDAPPRCLVRRPGDSRS